LPRRQRGRRKSGNLDVLVITYLSPVLSPSDGALTESARKMLEALRSPATPEAVAQVTGLPLFRVRSGLRELAQAGLLEETEGHYQLTEAGRQKI